MRAKSVFQGTSEEFLQKETENAMRMNLKPHPTYLEMTIRSHLGCVNSVSISPNGKFLASGGKDGILRIFELHTGKLLKQVVLIKRKLLGASVDKYFKEEINCVRFNPMKSVSIIACGVGRQIVFVDCGLSFGLGLQETRQNTKNLLNLDVSKVVPLRNWKWECLQGIVTNELDI